MKDVKGLHMLTTLLEKCPNTDFFSGSYFPIFGLNTEIYSVGIQENTDQKNLRIWTLFTQCYVPVFSFIRMLLGSAAGIQ